MAATLYIFYGEDEFSMAEAVEQVKAGLGPPEALSANSSVLDGRRVALAELLMACGTVPFLADHRLVIAEGLLDRFAPPAGRTGGRRAERDSEERGIGEWGGLAEAAGAMPPSTTLIVTGGPPVRGAQNPLLRSLERVGQCRRFPAVRAAQMVGWINERARRRGGRLAGGATRLLADFSGGSLRLLDQEIEKLCTYAGAEAITEEMVRRLCHSAREALIFDLTDAVAQRRREAAMRALEQLLSQGMAPPVIMAMLARQVRQMIAAKALTGQRASRASLMSALGTSSDFAADKAVEQARSYRMEELRALMDRLLETDLAFKTGALTEELALELLVAEAAGPGRT